MKVVLTMMDMNSESGLRVCRFLSFIEAFCAVCNYVGIRSEHSWMFST